MALVFVAATGCGDDGDGSTPACPDEPGVICAWAGTGEAGFNQDGLAPLATRLYQPADVSFSPDGVPYIADFQNHRIRKIENGVVETVIGTEFIGDGPDIDPAREFQEPGVPGTEVNLNHPTALTFLPDGRVLLTAWHNHKLRVLDPLTGLVRVTCGTSNGFTGDGGPASMAKLFQPKNSVLGEGGELFVLDNRNHRIRRIGPDDIITTVAGSGMQGFAGDGGDPMEAQFSLQRPGDNPAPTSNLARGPDGKLYVADAWNNRIRVVDLVARTIDTIAGNGEEGYAGDGGPATAAMLAVPGDLEFGPDGRLYVADTENHAVRAIDLATGIITTVVGTGVKGNTGDGGPATAAQLYRPWGVAFDADGNLYVADTGNSRIRRVRR